MVSYNLAMLQTLSTRQWDENFSSSIQQQAISNLESGSLLYFPELAFSLTSEEKHFLSPDYADPRAKNIGYHPQSQKIWGYQRLTEEQCQSLANMLARFSRYAHQLIKALLPHYSSQLMSGRASFRPVQISYRKTSYRKDDKRLHVDAFPSSPNQGKRILRVFCNVNPQGEDRVWRLGEPFEVVAKRFLPMIRKPFPGKSSILRSLKITKSYRTLYDHYMLRMHDSMKADEQYQVDAQQQEIRFPANTTWVVQTDHVSHAAMRGQHMLEQTFYLPVQAMQNESLSPLRTLERLLQRKLV